LSAISAIDRVNHTRLRQHSRNRRCERRANYDDDLIKEKIELMPIEVNGLWGMHYENKDFFSCSNVVDSCFIGLLGHRGADKRICTSTNTDQAGQFIEKMPLAHSNPTAASDGFLGSKAFILRCIPNYEPTGHKRYAYGLFLFIRSLCLY